MNKNFHFEKLKINFKEAHVNLIFPFFHETLLKFKYQG